MRSFRSKFFKFASNFDLKRTKVECSVFRLWLKKGFLPQSVSRVRLVLLNNFQSISGSSRQNSGVHNSKEKQQISTILSSSVASFGTVLLPFKQVKRF